MTVAPYQAIAAELRHRIESGALRPGDRVPSTRALMREYGVAMATATKALQALQQERLVHASPGVGTVVGPPPRARTVRPTPRPTPPPSGLTLQQGEVLRMGIAIADAEGLAAVSMRRIAAELGVSTMALYRHIGGKDALVLQMIDAAFGEYPLPELTGDWRAQVTAVARTQWAAYRQHLWLAGALSVGRPQLLPKLLPYTDALLAAFKPLEKSAALYAAISVVGYVRGLAQSMEGEAQAEQDTGMTGDDWAERQGEQLAALVAAGGLTAFAELLADNFDFDYDLDQLFAFGLELLLDGLAARLRP
ncbi:GntR family transcriptional regulator [Kribbella sandramycini]|uniref:AcrR family transcriptional regulator n=1 Tax=Kribbella sandramycini TaxID=60450 RepID=A0A7Y4L4W1_9ACTN|nr:GntR family transcriptional regulator [Kribbella sandramycini]MBB6571788.1 AcrR family transcriptional regulator [Kribbella sandramycini]NOL44430.1 GntR family transcriptional regulator [Kribbella sandramycini]